MRVQCLSTVPLLCFDFHVWIPFLIEENDQDRSNCNTLKWKYSWIFTLSLLHSPQVSGSLSSNRSPTSNPVSLAQHLATFLSVYPPPPNTIIGIPNDFVHDTHSPWPSKLNAILYINQLDVVSSYLRLKFPNRSLESESAPHWRTITSGW